MCVKILRRLMFDICVSALTTDCSHHRTYLIRTGSHDYRSDESIPMPFRII